jgi:hypothetical protein
MTVDAPRFVDPFDGDGCFRPVEAVVADLLDPDHGGPGTPFERTAVPLSASRPRY